MLLISIERTICKDGLLFLLDLSSNSALIDSKKKKLKIFVLFLVIISIGIN